MSSLLAPGIWLLLGAEGAASAYLTGLAGLALWRKPRPPAAEAGKPWRLAVIVPAHDEEALLPRLLASLAGQEYPADLYAVHVIADNCGDATAVLARAAGVAVHERDEPESPGKGQAIAWLLPRLPAAASDAYVFVDADSIVEPGFLAALARELDAGHLALQASYRVADPDRAPLVTLRALAFALMHELRGRGKARLGLSCGIWGNGFVLRREALERVAWQSFSGVEDAEQHLLLVLAGLRVAFAPEARVYGDMPASFRAAGSQQRRWEAGRLALLRRYGLRLAVAAGRRRDGAAAAALLELALPPLSLLLSAEAVLAALAWTLGSAEARLVALAAPAGLLFYVAVGFRLSGLRPRSYLALLHAPGYVLWKIALYAREALRRAEPAWVRTNREG